MYWQKMVLSPEKFTPFIPPQGGHLYQSLIVNYVQREATSGRTPLSLPSRQG